MTKNTSTTRRPDSVTEVRMGNTALTVSGYFKRDITGTAADKMAKVQEAKIRCQQRTGLWSAGDTSVKSPNLKHRAYRRDMPCASTYRK